MVAALWGKKRRSRCREIVLTLFVNGHLVDPSQDASYQCLRQLRRMEEQRPETLAELERVRRSYANGDEICDGPVATVHSVLHGMGWHWQAPTPFTREGRPHLRLVSLEQRNDLREVFWTQKRSGQMQVFLLTIMFPGVRYVVNPSERLYDQGENTRTRLSDG